MERITCEAKPDRRGLLELLLYGGVLGWIGSVAFPVLKYLKPLAAAGISGPVRLTAEDQAKLDREHSVIVRAGPNRILIFEDAEQRLRALSARCTHEGCTVQFVPGDSVIWCACHNGRFDLDGRVLAGPPPRPLDRHTALREADGTVLVTLGRGGSEAA